MSSPAPMGRRIGHRLYSTNWLTKAAAGLTLTSTETSEEPMDEPTEQLNRTFAALADPTRRDIVARLAGADSNVSELAEPYDMSLQAVSKHVKVLEEAGLVTRSRDAQRRPVHLDAEVFGLMAKWIERYRQEAEQRYRRLDALLESIADTETPHTKEVS